MSTILNCDIEDLKAIKGEWTAREIAQQPKMWTAVSQNIFERWSVISKWLNPILKERELRIILVGAGTSAYIGNALAPYLSKINNRVFESVSTTDIVSCPEYYLKKNQVTLMVSFGRSGNSPESIAAIDLANQMINKCFHLIITCNSSGELSSRYKKDNNAYVLLMPEETHDQSFAMTSSFTTMYVATLCIFSPSPVQLKVAMTLTEKILESGVEEIKSHANLDVDRVVFLGSGCLQGIAQEAALKCLELTSGKIAAFHESPLGFRHGPKTLVNEKTDIIILSATDSYTSSYETDLSTEIKSNGRALNVKQLNSLFEDNIQYLHLSDVWIALPYIVYCQVYAFFKAKKFHIAPDNPSPSGEVNRVVKGVNIYSYGN